MQLALSIQGWAHAARSALGSARPEIDALNVFPVPDGDTGTNAYLTIQAACEAADAAAAEGASRAGVVIALAQGAMLGARGNSGVILAAYLRGVGHPLRQLADGHPVGGRELAAMLAEGANLAYQAVSRPVEGTILTVASAAAQAAAQAGSDLLQVARAAASGASVALERTPSQLPALAAAGVVDAGGRALVVILDALVAVLTGEEPARATPARAAPAAPTERTQPGAAPSYQGPQFEVMYLLHAPAPAAQQLRADLDALGEAVLVSGEGELWTVHAHVDDAGAAIEAAMAHGRPSAIKVSSLRDGPTPGQLAQRILVAVVHGPGIEAMLADLGVRTIWAEPQQRPSAAQILEAITGTGASEVVLLPSDSDTQPVAELAARQARSSTTRVAVIPTRAVVQTLAAIAVHDPGRAFDDDAVAMTRAAGATRYAAVTVASRQALTTAGPCEVGDVLGIVGGDIAVVGPSVDEVARGILDAMLAVGGELVTLVLGSGGPAHFGPGLAHWLATAHPTVEVTVVDGGQPNWPVIIGVE